MGVYINKAELLKELSVIQDRPIRSAMQIIKILPTIDLVRCGECKRHKNHNGKCTIWDRTTKRNFYCKYGERRADEHNTERD